IVVNSHREINAAVEVFLDRFHSGDLAGEGEVEDIGAATRAKPHAAALGDLGSANVNTLEPPPVSLGVPAIHARPPWPAGRETCRAVPSTARAPSPRCARATPRSARRAP